MTSDTVQNSPPISRGKKFAFAFILLGFAGIAAFILAEVFLRLVPIPGIGYHTFHYSAVTGGRHYPGTTVLYRNPRGDVARRDVNSYGFLDIEYEQDKPGGVERIGFFGDSYTEARQVSLEETFFRRIDERLKGEAGGRYECLSFGMSGYSTLQAYLECQQWMDTFSLDHVVYVFVENDPGDQIREIARSDGIPVARMEDGELVVDMSFRDRYTYKSSAWHRVVQYLKSRSLVLSTLRERLTLLRRRGVKLRVTEDDMQMAERANENELPRSGMALSTWPDSLVQHTAHVGRLVLERWIEEVRASGRDFSVLYIPLEREMAKPYPEQDSWVEWLSTVCRDNNVAFIDPSPAFVDARARGVELYYDHLTSQGHEVLSNVFVNTIIQ